MILIFPLGNFGLNNNLNIPYHRLHLFFNTFACVIKQTFMINGEINIPNERQLLIGLNAHDQEAFTIIYNLYSKKLFRYAVKIIKSTEIAEDTVHDVFVKLWDNAPTLQIETTIQAYLYRSTHNYLMNLIKRGAVEGKFVDEVISSAAVASQNTEETISYRETLKQAKKVIDSLPPQRKLIYEMGRNKGMSHKQIALELNIADSTVNNQIVKALKTIKEHLMISGSLGMALALIKVFYK